MAERLVLYIVIATLAICYLGAKTQPGCQIPL